jgi:hypothetical protein
MTRRIGAELDRRRRSGNRSLDYGFPAEETVAMLCSIGLLDLDECDRFEPEVNPRPHTHQQH